jgi:hypothetical protein
MDYSKEFLDLLKSVTAKRPKTVIDHILQYGFITTGDLKNKYGYNHPPRAVRDVKEYGIPIETYRVDGTDGRKIAAYKFGKFTPEIMHRISGRTALSKKIKEELITLHGSKCFIIMKLWTKGICKLIIESHLKLVVILSANKNLNIICCYPHLLIDKNHGLVKNVTIGIMKKTKKYV